MRKTCLVCVRKHLTQALILLLESKKSEKYEWHRWLACGHMAEAEDECLQKYPGFASNIRQNRIKVEQNELDTIDIWFKKTIEHLSEQIEDEPS